MKILFLILVFGLAKDTYSQRPEIVETELDSAFNLGNRKEMESMIIWKLTSELDLEVEQAEKFFPRFRKHRKEIEVLRKKDRLLAKSIKLDISQNKKLKQSEVVKMIKELSSFRRKIADLEDNFLIKSIFIFSAILRLGLTIISQAIVCKEFPARTAVDSPNLMCVDGLPLLILSSSIHGKSSCISE